MKLETTKLELSEAANPRLPHLLWWTPLVNTRRRTPPCSPGRSETDYLLKESVVKKMFLACPASIGKYWMKFLLCKIFSNQKSDLLVNTVNHCLASYFEFVTSSGQFLPHHWSHCYNIVSADVPTCSDVTLDTNNVTQSSFYSLNGFINSTPICYEGGCWCKHI